MATLSLYSRRPSRNVSHREPRDASNEGNLAVTEETESKGREITAMSQKQSGGLSVETTPLTCGTTQRPSASISRAPSAKYGSSGADRS